MSIVVDLDFRSDLCPVRDQGSRPTCLSFATTTAHEYARKCQQPLSPEYLHYFASKLDISNGTTFSDVTEALRKNGQPIEELCPYWHSGLPTDWTLPIGVQVHCRNSETHEASVELLSTLLRSSFAPVLGISVPEPFFAPVDPWLLSGEGSCRGTHAVVAVGIGRFNETRCFLIRNSWGTDWGHNGYVWLSESFIIQHLRTICVLTGDIV